MQNRAETSLYLLFGTLVVTWGLAWPISKIGLNDMSPIWYSATRFLIGIVAILIYLTVTKQLKLPKRQDLPFIFSIGLFQMAAYLTLLNYGLSYVGAGRAAILTYSTPMWVTPIAILFFGEKLNKFKLLGLILGIAGIFALFSPWTFDWSNTRVVEGNLMLAGAAVVWAGVILHTRFGKWHSEPIVLLPWQMLLAGVVTCALAFGLESDGFVNWTPSLISTLLYTGIAATAFGYWASIVVSKALPVTTSSIGFLGVPVVGLLSSVVWLGEEFTLSLGLALALIVTGMLAMTKGSSPTNSRT
jgi:drug/metabolite transporter (DMT)-like permease